MKLGQQRVRWSEEKFAAVLRAQRSSGLTLQAYCRREGINLSSVYRWRDRVGTWQGARRHAVERKTLPVSDFIPLTVPPSGSPLTLRFELGGGVVLTVSR